MDTVEIEFDVSSTDADVPLGFCAKVDDQIIVEIDHVKQPQHIKQTIDLEDGEHVLQLFLHNKSTDHTVIDEHNNIIKDASLNLGNLKIDQQELMQIISEQGIYHHDYNGTRDPIEDRFYGELGCNGSVELRFSVPSYIWFLEVM